MADILEFPKKPETLTDVLRQILMPCQEHLNAARELERETLELFREVGE